MLDCGIHPGRTGDDALPFFDSGPDAEEIDIILISHFHLDHAASLPYFTEKVQGGAFKGRIFATHPTKAIMRLMLQNHIRTDSVRLAADGTSADEGAEAPLYTEEELQACLDKIEVIDFQQVRDERREGGWEVGRVAFLEILRRGAPRDHGCSSIRISNNKELAVCCVKEHLKSPQPSSWAWGCGGRTPSCFPPPSLPRFLRPSLFQCPFLSSPPMPLDHANTRMLVPAPWLRLPPLPSNP